RRTELHLRLHDRADAQRALQGEGPGGDVAVVSELLDGEEHLVAGALFDARMTVEHARDGHVGDAGGLGDLAHARSLRGGPCAHVPPSWSWCSAEVPSTAHHAGSIRWHGAIVRAERPWVVAQSGCSRRAVDGPDAWAPRPPSEESFTFCRSPGR